MVLRSFLYARLKNGRIMPWQCPSVRLSVCPSVRPSGQDEMSEETSLDHDQTGPKTSPEPHRKIADPHRRITINILEILELPIFAYHTYYTSKHMYNWMKWLRLLGGWHFIAATAIKPPKAACQFAADDILLYKICYNIQWIYFTIWEKGKEELSPLHYHFKSLHIISRHYKKSLLRSQIYHGYEELSTDTNYPIWRRQKLPYMKKTRKKKQVCGAACFMAAEIKFSEDVRPGFPDFSSTCFEISIWNLVYTFSRWHDMSSLSCITIGSLWPSLQPKVGQTHFLQSWPHKSR